MLDIFTRASDDGNAGLNSLKISWELISLQRYLFIPILQANFFKSRRQKNNAWFSCFLDYQSHVMTFKMFLAFTFYHLHIIPLILLALSL